MRRHVPLPPLIAALVVAWAVPAAADTVGGVDPDTAQWTVRTTDGGTETMYFGTPGDVPLAGDWDCDGVDTGGMYRPETGFVYLQDGATGVAAEHLFFGAPGDVLLAGDWDGDGCDSLAVYRRSLGKVMIANDVAGGVDREYYFGVPGDKPFAGDFDGDGSDEIGLHRESTGFVYLRLSHTQGFADAEFFYGIPADRLVAGDWDLDGTDTVAVFRPGARTFFLRNHNSQGFADEYFPFGADDFLPVAGEFDAGAAAAETAPPPLRSFTLAASGDLLIHSAVRNAAAGYAAAGGGFDFSPMFEPVRERIAAADLAICHLEVPLSPDNSGLSSYPRFNAPHELAFAIESAGFEACSTASNHSLDKGAAGVFDTLGVLDAAGVRHAGTARGPEEDVPTLYEAGGVTVGHISATYGLNGLPIPAGSDWIVNLWDAEAILADAAAARAAGAEFVVVSLHWGWEYHSDPNPDQLALAERLLASPDVDLILGHHAHVVQPVGRLGDEYVVYGMGNFLSNQRTGNTRVGTEDGVIMTLSVEERPGGGFRVAAVEFTPTYVEEGSFRILDVAASLADPSTPPELRARLEVSWARTVERVTRLGAPGVTVSDASPFLLAGLTAAR